MCSFRDRISSLWAIVWRCLRDSKFSGFDTIPACDRRPDRQRDRQTDGRTTKHGKNESMSLTYSVCGIWH